MLTPIKRKFLAFALVASASLFSGAVAFADDYQNPSRANDLLYGEVVYKFHQGNFFEALSLLGVAKEKNGIQGHGDHPLLLEGGLMLAYGMTRSAHEHFEQLLDDEMDAELSDETRNQAWFYLGKVFYLERDFDASKSAFEKVDAEILRLSNEALFFEWRYLLNQIIESQPSVTDQAVTSKLAASENTLTEHRFDSPYDDQGLEDSLENQDTWALYALYNNAVRQQVTSGPESTLSALENTLGVLLAMAERHGSSVELEALHDRILLTLAQLLLQTGAYTEAVQALQKIPYESLVADEALFYYAVAQSHLHEHALAVSALNRLNEKNLFTPWLQQVPFALAYLYEQLDDPSLAVQAYKTAGDHYDALIVQIEEQQQSLDEQSLLAALEIPFAQTGEGSEEGYFTSSRPVILGHSSTENDAYGRLRVKPSNFFIAELLATETFQLSLRDLHELYKLQSSLQVWEARVQSFGYMLETRDSQRREKLQTVAAELSEQDAQAWTSQYKRYKTNVDAALDSEDLRFFMDENQIEMSERLVNAKQTLSQLPEGDDKREFANKLGRIERYFEWQLADQFGVNRWAAQKQVIELGEQVQEFEQRRSYLQAELNNEAFQKQLVERVEDAGTRISGLRKHIDAALENARQQLLAHVNKELERQKSVVTQHRLSARHAQARLTDLLYRGQGSEAVDSTEQEGQL